jgi:Bacterial capsule synthesis protein PGA_cap
VGYDRHGGAGQGHPCWARGVARALATTPPQALVAPEVRDALGEADLVVLNLECCISERGRPWDAPGKPFFFRAPPRAVELLALLGTDCVTLANNHALDYGVAAAGRLVLADPLGGGRQPRHRVVSRAEQVVVWSFRIVS